MKLMVFHSLNHILTHGMAFLFVLKKVVYPIFTQFKLFFHFPSFSYYFKQPTLYDHSILHNIHPWHKLLPSRGENLSRGWVGGGGGIYLNIRYIPLKLLLFLISGHQKLRDDTFPTDSSSKCLRSSPLRIRAQIDWSRIRPSYTKKTIRLHLDCNCNWTWNNSLTGSGSTTLFNIMFIKSWLLELPF